jgi:fermentation-respiration switch protein FrsA (DUF1100 family)
MLSALLVLGILAAVLLLGARLMERALIWHPTRTLEATPADIGLGYEDVTFAAEDGCRLHGWFVPHPAARATVLFFHGNAGNISHRLGSLAQFHALRVNVFLVDYRGYGRSGGAISEAGSYRDAAAAYRWLRQSRRIPADRIVLFGRSLGAALAADVAAREPAAGLIVESGFTSTRDMGRALYPWFPVWLLVPSRYDSLAKMQRVGAPVLVLHSRQDDLVPCSHGERLYEAAPGAKTFFAMRGGHNSGPEETGPAYDRALNTFITEVCPDR